MSKKQSTARLVLYILATMLTSASAGFPSVDLKDPQAVISFLLAVLATGAVTARSYLDQSPNQVVDEKHADS